MTSEDIYYMFYVISMYLNVVEVLHILIELTFNLLSSVM